MKYYGKEKLISHFNSLSQNNKLPHAILLYGDKGVGKKTLASYIAGLFLCDTQNACQNCRQCKLIFTNTHPDVTFVKADKYTVQIMRDVIADSMIKPNDTKIKVYVFNDCGDMSAACQNTILKLIEEPPSYVRFIFTADKKDTLLETILSRVTAYLTEPPDAVQCTAALGELGIKDSKKLAAIFGGNIGKCLDTVNNEKAMQVFNISIEIVKAITCRNEYSIAAAMIKITDKDTCADVLSVILEIIRDAVMIKTNCKTSLISCSEETAEKLAEQFGLKTLLIIADKINDFHKNSGFNLNLPLSLTYYASDLYSVID